jgi:hypothetical protein
MDYAGIFAGGKSQNPRRSPNAGREVMRHPESRHLAATRRSRPPASRIESLQPGQIVRIEGRGLGQAGPIRERQLCPIPRVQRDESPRLASSHAPTPVCHPLIIDENLIRSVRGALASGFRQAAPAGKNHRTKTGRRFVPA